jgi:hypothetical protein
MLKKRNGTCRRPFSAPAHLLELRLLDGVPLFPTEIWILVNTHLDTSRFCIVQNHLASLRLQHVLSVSIQHQAKKIIGSWRLPDADVTITS